LVSTDELHHIVNARKFPLHINLRIAKSLIGQLKKRSIYFSVQ